MIIWSATILSALLGSIAYIYAAFGSWLLICAVILLWFVHYHIIAKDDFWPMMVKSVLTGMVWGFIFFGTHFIWVYVLLATKSHGSWTCVCSTSLLLVLYFTVTSIVWLCSANVLGRLLSKVMSIRCASIGALFITGIGYLWFLLHASLWFCGRFEGYPLLDPRILGTANACVITPLPCTNAQGFTYYALKPPSAIDIHDPYAYGRALQEQLDAYALKNKQSRALIVGPESCFPYALHEYPDIIDSWQACLAPSCQLLIGALRHVHTPKEKWYQTVYWIHKGRIQKFHDKTHTVPFNERIPRAFSWCTGLCNLFLRDGAPISRGRVKTTEFNFTTQISCIPCICSELFELVPSDCAAQPDFVLWLVNDSWFLSYVQDLLMRYACFWAFYYTMTVVYVGHEYAYVISPLSKIS